MLRKEVEIKEKTYTVAEFMRLFDDGKKYELWEGKLEEVSPTKPLHNIIAGRLNGELYAHVKQNKLGEVFPEPPFRPNPTRETVIVGDVGFISRAHLGDAAAGALLTHTLINDMYVFSVLDLMIEIVSEENRRKKAEFKRKIRSYQQAAIPLVWVIDPAKLTVEVYHPTDLQPLLLGINDELDGEDVIPGFRLKIETLFAMS